MVHQGEGEKHRVWLGSPPSPLHGCWTEGAHTAGVLFGIPRTARFPSQPIGGGTTCSRLRRERQAPSLKQLTHAQWPPLCRVERVRRVCKTDSAVGGGRGDGSVCAWDCGRQNTRQSRTSAVTDAALSLLLRQDCVLHEHTQKPDNTMYAAVMCAQTGHSVTEFFPWWERNWAEATSNKKPAILLIEMSYLCSM